MSALGVWLALTLCGAGTIVGTVVDESGRPTRDAWVELLPETASEAELTRLTEHLRSGKTVAFAQMGAFKLAEVEDGNYYLRASVRSNHSLYADRFAHALVSVTHGSMRNVRLQFSPGLTLEGRVLDASGKPVGQASVALNVDNPGFKTVSDWSGARTQVAATADGSGRFRVANLKPQPLMAVAFKAGYLPAELLHTQPGARVELRVAAASLLTARVLDPSHEPVRNFMARLDQDNSDFFHDGDLAIPVTRDRDAVVELSLAGRPNVYRRVHLRAGQSLALPDIVWPSVRRAAVTLVDAATGAAIAHGEVVAYGLTPGENEGVRLDDVLIRGESGTLERLPPERVRVVAESSGFAPTAATLEPKDASLAVRMGHGVSLVGTVIDSAGQPVACLVLGAKAEGSHREIQVISDASGRFRISGLTAGEVKLFIQPSGISSGMEQPAGCRRGRPDRPVVTPRVPVELRLGPAGEVPVEIKLGLREEHGGD